MFNGHIRTQFTTTADHRQLQSDEIRHNIEVVSTPLLLMIAVNVTGDLSLLDEFERRIGTIELKSSMPMPIKGPDAEAARAEDPAARKQLTEILVEHLSQPEHEPYESFENRPEVFHRMSEILVGEAAKEHHTRMNMEQAGFAAERRVIRPTKPVPKTLNLAIIGAGMTGIDAAVKATDRGVDFAVFEKEAGIGGLWFSQRYPGVAVDTPSTFYSLSWNVTPDWSRQYPLGTEYQQYLAGVADKYDLWNKFHFGSEVTKMAWLEDEQVWELTVRSAGSGEVSLHRAAAVLSATGHLCRPKFPNVSGIESFAGESVHTGNWRPVDVAGKKVAVVGAGAAGVQVVSAIAGEVANLYLFQRQPHFITKNTIGEGLIDDRERWVRRYLPYYSQWNRLATFTTVNDMCWKMNVVDDEWMKDNPLSVSRTSEFLRQESLAYIKECFGEDAELTQKLSPSFMYGGKRPVRDPGDWGPGGYYWSLAQSHVEVIGEHLTEVVPEGIVTADGHTTDLDVIIWATGMTQDFMATIEVVGRDGRLLSDEWAYEDVRTYLGGTVPGFPNMFVQDGPNTGAALGGTGHNFMSESLNHYILECLQFLVEMDAKSMEVTREAYDAHNDKIDSLMEGLLWNVERDAHTYYRNAAGRVYFPNPIEIGEFWRLNQAPDADAYVLRGAGGADVSQ